MHKVSAVALASSDRDHQVLLVLTYCSRGAKMTYSPGLKRELQIRARIEAM